MANMEILSLCSRKLMSWAAGIVLAAICTVAAGQGTELPRLGNETAQTSANNSNANNSNNKAIQLAAKIAKLDNPRATLLESYQSVYGSIDKVPEKWPALVRRVLVCQQIVDQTCIHSSLDAINKLGGVEKFPLEHLFEVSRFGMTVFDIRTRLKDAAQEKASPAVAETVGKEELAEYADLPHIPTGKAKSADEQPEKNDASATASATSASVGAFTSVPAVDSANLTQRTSARLSKLINSDQPAFFLNALFASGVLCLILLYFWFSASRARKIEHIERLLAQQEIQRLENLRTEEKLQTDHDLWSEQLKTEVALEAQKTHSEELLRIAQLAAEEALRVERLNTAEAIKAERAKAEQEIQAEKTRAAELVKTEQMKAEVAIKGAKLRADQAIDAYDQMAAKELIYAHKESDDLQEALNAEKERRETQELKTEEALQAIEAFKQKEVQLHEAIRAEQRARASEARLATEKLKAAQQAAAALQTLLAETRACKVDLTRRLEEATQLVEQRSAEASDKIQEEQPTPSPQYGAAAHSYLSK